MSGPSFQCLGGIYYLAAGYTSRCLPQTGLNILVEHNQRSNRTTNSSTRFWGSPAMWRATSGSTYKSSHSIAKAATAYAIIEVLTLATNKALDEVQLVCPTFPVLDRHCLGVSCGVNCCDSFVASDRQLLALHTATSAPRYRTENSLRCKAPKPPMLFKWLRPGCT